MCTLVILDVIVPNRVVSVKRIGQMQHVISGSILTAATCQLFLSGDDSYKP